MRKTDDLNLGRLAEEIRIRASAQLITNPPAGPHSREIIYEVIMDPQLSAAWRFIQHIDNT